MAEKLPQEQMVSMTGLAVSHRYEMLALITVLEKKGILFRKEANRGNKKCGGIVNNLTT